MLDSWSQYKKMDKRNSWDGGLGLLIAFENAGLVLSRGEITQT